MSEAVEITVSETPAPPKRAGAPRRRPIQDWKAVAKKQEEQLAEMEAKLTRALSLITSGVTAQGQQNPLAQFLPPKPIPVKKPEGYNYMLSHIPEHENDDNEKLSTHMRRVPARPDNPNEPDPRYCPFCQQDVTRLYGHKNIPGNPSPEQQAVIDQCKILHEQDAAAKSGSKRKGKEGRADREFAANHLQMKYVKAGPVEDQVAWMFGRGWTAAEWNERELQLWEARCRSIGLGMAQGGI